MDFVQFSFYNRLASNRIDMILIICVILLLFGFVEYIRGKKRNRCISVLFLTDRRFPLFRPGLDFNEVLRLWIDIHGWNFYYKPFKWQSEFLPT
jgi:hypothetical protein